MSKFTHKSSSFIVVQIGKGLGISSGFHDVQELLGHLATKVVIVRTTAPFPAKTSLRQSVVADAIRKVPGGTVLGQGMRNSGSGDGVDEGSLLGPSQRFLGRISSLHLRVSSFRPNFWCPVPANPLPDIAITFSAVVAEPHA